jgi:hypothetical protein
MACEVEIHAVRREIQEDRRCRPGLQSMSLPRAARRLDPSAVA